MSKSKIEWCTDSWNPVTGCDKISAGCTNCYAKAMAERLQAMNKPNYRNGFKLTVHHHELEAPLKWRKPLRIFVCSMADLFHSEVPDLFIQRVFNTMGRCPHHTFMCLTKRTQRLGRLAGKLPWRPNIWMGVSLESRDWVERVGILRKVPAHVRFISAEPLLESLGPINLEGIHQVIAGGESGRYARPMDPDWARELRDQCAAQNVAFFMKQLGGRNGKRSTMEELPEDLRIREWPEVKQDGLLF